MESTFYPYLIAFAWMSMLFQVGVFLRAKIKFFQTFLVPASLIGGIIGFILMNTGLMVYPTSNGLEALTTKTFGTMTYHLFAFSFIGIGLIKNASQDSGSDIFRGGLWGAILVGASWAAQALVAFGVFYLWKTVAGGDFYEGLGFLAASGFTQGPGQVQATGLVWEQSSNIANAASTGLAFSAMGFFVAVFVGVPLAKYALKKGIVSQDTPAELSPEFLKGLYPKTQQPCTGIETTNPANIDSFAFHLGLMLFIYGLAYMFGLAWTNYMPAIVKSLGYGMMFSWTLVIAFIVRKFMSTVHVDHLMDNTTIRRFTGCAIDYLVCSSFISINAAQLEGVLFPFFIAIAVVTFVTFLITLFFARRSGPHGVERGLVYFGAWTGTGPTGLLLLRIVDPDFKTPIPIELGIMNGLMLLFQQPLFIAYPLIPTLGFTIFPILLAYLILSPVALYLLRLVKPKAW